MNIYTITFPPLCSTEPSVQHALGAFAAHPLTQRHKHAAAEAYQTGKYTARAVWGITGKIAVHGDTLAVNGIQLNCPGFSHIPSNAAVGCIIWFASVHDIPESRGSLLYQTYCDLLADRALDHCRIALKEKLQNHLEEKHIDGQLSHCYGPGYYGMHPSSAKDLAILVAPQSIGIQVSDQGVLFPAKSACGIYLILPKDMEVPEVKCKNCLGDKRNCSYCLVNEEK